MRNGNERIGGVESNADHIHFRKIRHGVEHIPSIIRATNTYASGVKTPQFPQLCGTAEQGAEKLDKDSLQGLKPIGHRGFTPGLKPRPPKERTSTASCEAVPSREPFIRWLSGKVYQ